MKTAVPYTTGVAPESSKTNSPGPSVMLESLFLPASSSQVSIGDIDFGPPFINWTQGDQALPDALQECNMETFHPDLTAFDDFALLEETLKKDSGTSDLSTLCQSTDLLEDASAPMPSPLMTFTLNSTANLACNVASQDETKPYFLELCSSSPTSNSASPASILDVLDDNETFQDLSFLIQEKSTAQSSDSKDTTKEQKSTKCHFTSVTESSVATCVPVSKRCSKPNDLKREAVVLEDEDSYSKVLKMSTSTDPDKPDRYVEMRRKNNLASRISRQTRREKEKEMEEKAAELIQENETLKVKVKKLEELTSELKAYLINAIVNRK